jgi:excisionase family DNA binding protein
MNTTTQTKWTPEETEYLIEWAEFLPVEQIAKRVNKSIKTVRNKAKDEKLNLRPIYDNWSTYELARLLGINNETIRKWITNGELVAKQARKIKGSVFRITKENFKDFYLKYRDKKLCFRRVNKENLNWILEG